MTQAPPGTSTPLAYLTLADFDWLQAAMRPRSCILSMVSRSATATHRVPVFLAPPPGASFEPVAFVSADDLALLQRLAAGERKQIHAASNSRNGFTAPLYGPAEGATGTDREALLEAALTRLLDSDKDSALAQASDEVLREAAADVEQPAVIREQAAAVLQARVALGRSSSGH